jgi:dTDP-4-dehydrorhamnose reductase
LAGFKKALCMTGKVLILGGTGLLGQAVVREAVARKFTVLAAARHDAAVELSIADDDQLSRALALHDPDIVFNCAALADIDACEDDIESAWRINARPLALLSDWSNSRSRGLIHVSTDHYFTNGGPSGHDENAQVELVNEYARTKFAAEAFALTSPRALVLRTNIVGIRGWKKPTFAEWAIDIALNDKAATLFEDAYVSSIDVRAFAKSAFDLVSNRATGLLNLASTDIFSKASFVRELAAQIGCRLSLARSGSVSQQAVRRANCLGLDVSRAEARLGYALPSMKAVVGSVVAQYHESQVR